MKKKSIRKIKVFDHIDPDIFHICIEEGKQHKEEIKRPRNYADPINIIKTLTVEYLKQKV